MAVYETKLACLKKVGSVYYSWMFCLHTLTNNLNETRYFKKYQLLPQTFLDLELNYSTSVVFW